MNLSIITDQLSMDFNKALETAKKMNYKTVEVHSLWGKTVEELTKKEVLRVKKLLEAYDMQISCLGSTIFFMCPLYDYYELESFNDKFLTMHGDFNKHIEGLKRAAEISKQLNVDIIRIFPFRFPLNKKVVSEDDIKLISEKIFTAVKVAESYGVVLVLENCPHSHMPTGVMTKKVADSINSKYLKLLFDIGNSFRAPHNIIPKEYSNISYYEELSLIFNDIRHIHLKDYMFNNKDRVKEFKHITFGEGTIDYKKIMAKLCESKYKFAVSLESEVDYGDTLKSMKNLYELQTK